MPEDKEKQEEMYLAIELWQESNLSQKEFCRRERINYSVFGYWLKKYRKEHLEPARQQSGFLDVAVAPHTDEANAHST